MNAPLFGAVEAAAPAYGRLTLERGNWVLDGIPPHVAIRLKSLFPRLPKQQAKRFVMPATPEAAADLAWFMERYPLSMSAVDRAALRHGRQTHERARAELARILLPDWQPPRLAGLALGTELYPNQAQAVEMARRRGRLLVLDDVGLGKTLTGLATILDPRFLPAAVVVEPHLATQWRDQGVRKFTTLRAHIVAHAAPYSLPSADVYIFGYSKIGGWVDIFATGMFRSAVFDEIQQLRHGRDTVKGRAAHVLVEHVKLRVGLTATPIYNYGDEMFRVLEFIEPGLLGTWDEFTREWCSATSAGKWIVNDPDALGTYLRDNHAVLRRVRGGRPVNTLVHTVDHDQDVVDKAEALAISLAIKVTRGSFTEAGQAARELDMFARMTTGIAKAKHVAAFVRMLLEAGTPVILGGWHRDVYDIWLEELADFSPVMYTGSETVKRKDAAKAAFINGATNLVIISLRSGAGLDGLQERCSTVVFGELDWSPKVHEQLIGRADRPGQKAQEVTAIYCVSESGSDPAIVGVLGLKGSQARGITDPMAGIAHVHSDESRIRLLAEDYLKRHGREVEATVLPFGRGE